MGPQMDQIQRLMQLADDLATIKARYWCNHDDVTEGAVVAAQDALEAALRVALAPLQESCHNAPPDDPNPITP
jgi:hypothetical protein